MSSFSLNGYENNTCNTLFLHIYTTSNRSGRTLSPSGTSTTSVRNFAHARSHCVFLAAGNASASSGLQDVGHATVATDAREFRLPPFNRSLRDLRKPPKFPTSCGNGGPSTSCASQDAVASAFTCTGRTDFYVANRTFAFLVEVPFPTCAVLAEVPLCFSRWSRRPTLFSVHK